MRLCGLDAVGQGGELAGERQPRVLALAGQLVAVTGECLGHHRVAVTLVDPVE